ncbi:TonB-dependent receptor [Novosphingobium flavum]|uniref:TonB-dependent receptor n=1 Tax=Novosphingobium flavum TaxID=1778672 RepID=A0A7X1KN03_9SPHN|nr:TonB-dependent receptor [Novosphingobium flavum]MBC2667181.1 TonB-dependent receptor [Novosphingobium flavum]
MKASLFTDSASRLGQVSTATIAIALAVGLLAPGVAAAQEAAPPAATAPAEENDAETIIVQGFRASLESAIAAKKISNNIVDVIKADDIASMPDANLAESIQRIPGVSIQRDGGEGRNVTVRGLGGDFVRTTLNGIEAFSATTGSTLGVVAGINRTRGFDFSTFASELFNAITVSKSQSAEMDEGSLAASIDLATAKPFDKPGFRGGLSVQGAYYDNNRSVAPRVAGLLSNTWGDFGVLVSAAYSKRKAQEDGYSDTSQSDYSDALEGFCGTAVDIASQAGSQVVNDAIPFVNPLSALAAGRPNRLPNQCFSGKPSDPVAYAAINQPDVFLPRNPGLGRFQLDQERLGVTAAIQYQPSDDTHITIDGVYSRYKQDRTDYALSLASNNRNVNGASSTFPLFAGRVDSQIMDVHVQPSGQVDYMKLNNVDIKHIQERTKTTTQTYELALHLEQKLGDRLSFDGKVGIAGSDFDQPYTILMSYDGFNKDGYIWDARNDVRRPYINYGYDVTNPANVTFTNAGTGLTPDIRITKARVKNYLKTAAGNFAYELSDQIKLKSGVMYKEYTFRSEQTQRLFANNSAPCTVSSTNVTGTACTNPGAYTAFNFAQFAADFPTLGALSETLTGFGGQLGLPAGSVTSWVVPNVDAFVDKLGLLCNCANKYGDFTLGVNTGALGNNRSVTEKDLGVYGQADFDFDLGGHALRGNVGLRYVRTKVASTGFLSLTTQVTVPNSYTDWLPSANISYEIRNDLILRAAFAKVMARPGLNALNPGGTVNTTFGQQSATIGNPFLAPYRAKNYDLSLEWYPKRGTFYGLAFFYKDVGSTIQSQAASEPFGATGLPLSLLTGLNPAQDANTPYTVTRFRNTSGGYITGLEVNVQQPLEFLPGFLKHLGVAANYTYVKSKVLYYLSAAANAATTRDQFINVSPHSVNATLFYDDDRFSARVSVAYRDAYLTALPFKAEVPDGNYSYATTNVDASMSYKLTSRLKITADALNITNQAADQYSGAVRKSQRVFSTTGRQFFVGASYTF